MSYLDNIRTFVRVYELGSMSAAGRDLRISPAVTSSRISQLEEHLSVRLFQRTTRSLTPTEQGRAFYGGAAGILEAVESAEAQVVNITDNPKGSLYVAAPLGVGRRLIAPLVPGFLAEYPEVKIRLRLTDRTVDLTTEGLDLSFFLGQPEDSNLRIRKIADVDRILCASPDYIAARDNPASGEALMADRVFMVCTMPRMLVSVSLWRSSASRDWAIPCLQISPQISLRISFQGRANHSDHPLAVLWP